MKRIKLILMALKLIFLERKILKKQEILNEIYLSIGRLNGRRAIKVSKILEKQTYKFEKLEILFTMAKYDILLRESKRKVEKVLDSYMLQ